MCTDVSDSFTSAASVTLQRNLRKPARPTGISAIVFVRLGSACDCFAASWTGGNAEDAAFSPPTAKPTLFTSLETISVNAFALLPSRFSTVHSMKVPASLGSVPAV